MTQQFVKINPLHLFDERGKSLLNSAHIEETNERLRKENEALRATNQRLRRRLAELSDTRRALHEI